MFYDNFIYLLEMLNKKPLEFRKEFNVSHTTVWNWKKGIIPNKIMLRRLSKYFSEQLGYDNDAFNEGRDLTEKDLMTIFKTKPITNKPISEKLKPHEERFILQLRQHFNSSPDIDISETTLNECLELCRTIHGPIRHTTVLLRILKEAYGESGADTGGNRIDSGSKDK